MTWRSEKVATLILLGFFIFLPADDVGDGISDTFKGAWHAPVRQIRFMRQNPTKPEIYRPHSLGQHCIWNDRFLISSSSAWSESPSSSSSPSSRGRLWGLEDSSSPALSNSAQLRHHRRHARHVSGLTQLVVVSCPDHQPLSHIRLQSNGASAHPWEFPSWRHERNRFIVEM